MTKKKKSTEGAEAEKTEVAVKTKATPAPSEVKEKKTALAPTAPLDVWTAFDNAFERFRSDFEDLLFPSYRDRFLVLPETRVPVLDLEDREKDYLLKERRSFV
jgi:hypothetical protein